DPPRKTLLRMAVPAIERIAPELSGRTEVVGWHACDHPGAQVLVEVEQLRMRPDVRAVHRDEDRQVADDAHLPLVGMALEAGPLPERDPLHEAPEVDVLVELLPGLRQRVVVARRQRWRPRGPG